MSKVASIEEWVLDFKHSIRFPFEDNFLRFEVLHGIQVLDFLNWGSHKIFIFPVFLFHGHSDLVWAQLLTEFSGHPVDSVFSLVHQLAVKLLDVSVNAHIKRVGVNEWLEHGEIELISLPHIIHDDILHLVDLWQHLFHALEFFGNDLLLFLHELLLRLFQIGK